LKAKRSRYQQGTVRRVARANGFAWEVRFSETVNGQRKRKTIIFDAAEYRTEKDVRKAIQGQVALANTDNARHKVGATFGDIITIYRRDHLPTLRHSAQIKARYLLDRFIEPKWTETRIQDVTARRVLEWFGELGEFAPTTKAGIRSVMSQCFLLAALHEYIPATENPMRLVRIKGTSKRQKAIPILSQGDFKQLVAALPSPENLMVLLCGALGLRVGEMIALHWTDFDFENGTISIQRNFTRGKVGLPKTDESQSVLPLDSQLSAVLWAYKPTDKKKTGEGCLVFPSTRTGGYRAAGMTLQKVIQPVADKLNIGRVTWHGLRHSCRSWLSAAGVALGTQKDLLRHADVSTTMNKYGRALAPEMREAQSAIVSGLLPESMRQTVPAN
jgi:integrase